MPASTRTLIPARSIASAASVKSLASRAVARIAPLAALTALVAVVAACSMPVHTDASAAAPDPFNPAATQLLDDTHWTLTGWQQAGGAARAVPTGGASGEPLTLDLSTDGGQRHASGFSGCNRFAGSYTLKDGLLSFGTLASTRMACVGPGADIEQPFLDALAHIARSGVQWREPRELQLVLQNGDRLIFTQRKP
ncbi:MAG TPA: META domain-containing protein [Paraburkholderia sp.]|jgi:heat shock protein HslJ|nr:META domain-containing protein [Paraburkholderia sp.]